MKIEITNVSLDSGLYFQALDLRNLYLRQPLGLSFSQNDRVEDQTASHVVAKQNDRVIGCVLGIEKNDRVKIRQMVVHPEFQRQGIGSLLLRRIEQTFIDRGYSSFFLHARVESLDFYLKNKYQSLGDTFYEVGILHQVMEKRID